MGFHQLVVDSYAVQHPGDDDPRAIRSVGLHLMTLCLFLEHGVDPALGPRLHQHMVDRLAFHQLTPPLSRGRLTTIDVPLYGDAEIARRAANAWAMDAWMSWRAHHDTVRYWIYSSGLGK